MKAYNTRHHALLWMQAIAVMLLVSLAACGKDDPIVDPDPGNTDPDPVVPGDTTVITFSKLLSLSGPGSGDEVTLASASGLYSLFVDVRLAADAPEETTLDWALGAEDCSWLHLSSTEGNGSKLLSFKVGNNNGNDRQATITLYDPADPRNKAQLFITQEAPGNSSDDLLTQRHSMGYGYNIQMKYASDEAFSARPILDYDKIIKLENNNQQEIVTESYRHQTSVEMISTNTLTEMAQSMTDHQTEGSSWTMFGSVTDISDFTTRTKRVDQTCSYIRLKEIVSSRTVDMGMLSSFSPDQVFTQDFINAVNALPSSGDADNAQAISFVMSYGTHFCVSADLGGYVAIKATVTRDTLFTHHEITSVIAKKRFWIPFNGDSNTQSLDDDYVASLDPQYTFECEGGSDGAQQAIESTLKAGGSPALTDWQNSMYMQSGKLNEASLAVVAVRTIPIYDLINDASKRQLLRKVILKLLSKEQLDCPEMSQDKGYDSYTFNTTGALSHENLLTVGMGDTESHMLLAREYVPAIRKDQLVDVAYPMINGRPYLTRGIFLGDLNNRPGVVRWFKDESSYEPDTISMSNARHADLFDASTGQLKQVYYYFHDIHILPDANLDDVNGVTLSYQGIADRTKIGSLYWTRQADAPQLEKDVNIYQLPTRDQLQNLCNVAPYSLIEESDGMLGLNWPHGFERGSNPDNGETVEETNIYLPLRYQNGSQWELRVTRLSPAGSVPIYYPYTLCPVKDGKSMLLTPVHCSTTL